MNKETAVCIVVAVVVLASVGGLILYLDEGDAPEGPTITYIGNGGTTSGGDATYQTNGSILKDCKFSKEGYVFYAWGENEDGSGTTYSEGDEVPKNYYDEYKDMTVYAIWGFPIVDVSLYGYQDSVYADGTVTYNIKDNNDSVYLTSGGSRVPNEIIPAEQIEFDIWISANVSGWKFDPDSCTFTTHSTSWDFSVQIDIQNAIVIDGHSGYGSGELTLDLVPTGPMSVTIVYS